MHHMSQEYAGRFVNGTWNFVPVGLTALVWRLKCNDGEITMHICIIHMLMQ